MNQTKTIQAPIRYNSLRELDATATGQGMRRLLLEQNMTVAQLSQMMGISSQAIYHWLEGTQMPTLENLYRFSMIMNVDMDYLLIKGERKR